MFLMAINPYATIWISYNMVNFHVHQPAHCVFLIRLMSYKKFVVHLMDGTLRFPFNSLYCVYSQSPFFILIVLPSILFGFAFLFFHSSSCNITKMLFFFSFLFFNIIIIILYRSPRKPAAIPFTPIVTRKKKY